MAEQSTPITVILSAGHRNTTGGNPVEAAMTARWTPPVAAALRDRGFDVRTIQPQDGAGMFNGDVTAIGRKVVDLHRVKPVNVFLELHGESVNKRGCFAVYPDWPNAGDVDTIVRDDLGPRIARRIRDLTGIPLRDGIGRMSERSTGVGQLGIFRGSVAIKSTTRRMILECGSYGAPADRAIMNAPDFPLKLGAAIADALAAFYNLPAPGQADATVIGVKPSVTPDQWLGFLHDHQAPLSEVEGLRVYTFHEWLEVDPAFLGAVALHEGGSQLGASPLQRLTHQPINIRAAAGEWRPTVAYNGGLWHKAESFQLGCFTAALHLKGVHGAAGRHTVRAIIPVHAPASDDNDPDRFIASVLQGMAAMRRR